jgi:SAM-dependent methyltransferase|tara:strand:+ start:164 stop:1408 length:1245 start_codon:yes stop_codon:yes gene_type:complete
MIKKSYRSAIINNKLCICKNKLKQRINFGNLPLINNYKRKINLTKYPVVISQCEKCLLIQLKYSVSDKLLFPSDYSYLSGNSKEKLNNFKTIYKKIRNFSKKNNPKILDIGSNDGSFLNLVKNKYSNALGIEPTNSANIAMSKGVKTIKRFLNFNLAQKILNKYSKFDFIVATNIIAQTNNLDKILQSIKLLLSKKGLLIIEVQYLYDLLAQKGFDSFHPEHIRYYTLSSIIKVLENYKLYVFDAERLSVHGGILRAYASLNKKVRSKNLKKVLKKENDKKIFSKLKNLNSFRKKFNLRIKNFLKNLKKQKKKIYGIGAAPRACVLLNSSNITNREISLIGEVPQSLKCNKYIPGTNIMVKDENKIITDKPDYLVILAWHLKKQMIKLFFKKGYRGHFIIPLPKLKISKGKKLS